MADLNITQEDFNRLRLGSTVAAGVTAAAESDSLLGNAFNSVVQYFTTPEEAVANVRNGIHDAIPAEISALPYGQAIEDNIVNHVLSAEFRGSSYDLENFETDIESAVAQAFSTHMQASVQGVPAADRFAVLTQELTELGVAVGEPQQAQLNSAVTAIQDLDPQLQTAITNAVAHNPNFVEYIFETMGNEGADGSLTAMLEDLNPQAVGPLTGILNNIANNPTLEMNDLNRVIDTVTAHTDLMQQRDAAVAAEASNEEIARIDALLEAATTDMYAAIRDAGGTLPAFAELDGALMMAFMTDLVNGTGTAGAIANLGGALNMTPEQLEAFQELIEPFAGLIQFMAEPYADLYQRHGVAITEAFERTQTRAETLTSPGQEGFDTAAAAAREAAAIFEAPADTGNVVDFTERFTEAAEGADLTNVEVLLETLVEADPELADEASAIRSDADLMRQFTTWSGMMTSDEVAAASATELYTNLNRDIDVRTAVNQTLGM